ncbi:MAG: ADP-heptose--LPS heptosyltransferase 2 [Chlamydiia bacterium]|nr:ADP-heptose--LPS heptosyltransferase 2 [Chlamydiia bacterium]
MICFIFRQVYTNGEMKKLIVRMPNWIGDLVMALPLLERIAIDLKGWELTVVVKAPLDKLLLGLGHIHRIIPIDSKSRLFPKCLDGRPLSAVLRAEKFDAGILTTNSLSTTFHFWHGKVKKRTGFTNGGRNLLLNHVIDWPPELEKRHLVLTYQELLAPFVQTNSALGLTTFPVGQEIERVVPKQKSNAHPSLRPPRLHILEKERPLQRKLLEKFGGGEEIIGINPGAAYGEAKCWLPERFREVIEALLEERQKARIFLFGTAAQSGLNEQIIEGLGERVVNLAGKTSLRELIYMIDACSVFLTNDSGPMHMAGALRVPHIALFGSTNPIKTGPFALHKGLVHQVICKEVSCSPCYKRTCPIDFRCMKSITSQEVVKSMLKMLQKEEELCPL